ncbi:MAG: hypothetical protein MK108_19480 [Mariniblastus sp.]|nr:hypothetical protein [Mariniblastus sp.]
MHSQELTNPSFNTPELRAALHNTRSHHAFHDCNSFAKRDFGSWKTAHMGESMAKKCHWFLFSNKYEEMHPSDLAARAHSGNWITHEWSAAGVQ